MRTSNSFLSSVFVDLSSLELSTVLSAGGRFHSGVYFSSSITSERFLPNSYAARLSGFSFFSFFSRFACLFSLMVLAGFFLPFLFLF